MITPTNSNPAPSAFLSVDERLIIEMFRRVAIGAPTQVLMAVLCIIYTPTFMYTPYYIVAAMILTAILLFRLLLYYGYRSTPKLLLQKYGWTRHITVVTAILWAIVIGLAIIYFHLESFLGLIHIFMTNGLLIAVLYTLAPTPKIQQQYVLVLGLAITFAIFYCERGTTYEYAGLLLMIFVFYLFVASKTQSKDIRNMYTLEEKLLIENKMLRETRHELEIQKAKAEYSTRLAALGEMAGGVGHEINNPLGIIAGNTDLLRSKLTLSKVDPVLWQGHVNKITEIVTRIARIVRSLQNLARKTDSPMPEKIDLIKVIEETLDLSSEKFKMRSIKLVFDHTGPVWVLGHHVEIGQVLINLINNAYDAVKTSKEKIISLLIQQSNEEVILTVQDTGLGVSDEIREKLFQPFFTTKAIGEGSGLGLSISRSLLVKVGGDLVLTNLKNPTEFQVILKKPIEQK